VAKAGVAKPANHANSDII